MSTSQSQKKEAIAQAAEQELASLAARGVRIAGNACSPIVLVKGDLDDAERSGGELAAGADGAALRKAQSVTRPKIFVCWRVLPARATEL